MCIILVKVNVLIFRIYYTLPVDRQQNNRKKILTRLLLLNWVEGRIVFVFGEFTFSIYIFILKEQVVQNGWFVNAKNNKNNKHIIWTRQFIIEIEKVTLMIFLYLLKSYKCNTKVIKFLYNKIMKGVTLIYTACNILKWGQKKVLKVSVFGLTLLRLVSGLATLF